jgi:hypothetical protein
VTRPNFLNFTVDHMTLLLHPKLYAVAYPVFRIIFGVSLEEILYEKRRKSEGKEMSMTFATRIGQWDAQEGKNLHTVIAVVQPSEGPNEESHVRDMLKDSVAHWQHIALRTPDLLAFHKHAVEHSVQFVTPILKDESDNLIQVFSGEWYFPGSKATGLFFEFLQRAPSNEAMKEIELRNKTSWFRDETFMGLYGEKEREYRSGKVMPFLPEELFTKISDYIGEKQVFEITEEDIQIIQKMMKDHCKDQQTLLK